MIKPIIISIALFNIQVHSFQFDNYTIADYNNKTITAQLLNDFDTTPNVQYLLHHKISHVNLTLAEKIELEKNTWHWYPYKRIDYYIARDGTFEEQVCDRPSAIDDFPEDLFTQEQRLQGAVLLHFIGAIYFFSILAVVCSDYFIPSVECICEDLKLTQDVAAATFMATATTMPEFFTNTISTFMTESDMGLGTIIGSMMFNTLGVAALAGLATMKPVQLDWWPITRDSIIFSVNVGVLVAVSWDGRIYWYETIIFIVLYFVYFIVMFQNKRMLKLVKKYIEDQWSCCSKRAAYELDAEQPAENVVEKGIQSNGVVNPAFVDSNSGITSDISESMTHKQMHAGDLHIPALHVIDDAKPDEVMSLWIVSRESRLRIFWWYYSWPIRFLLTFTVPNISQHRRFYPITFIMCIIWLAASSFLIFWMVTVIGFTFSIPESVMGLTFLAAGGCLPEAVSAIIITRTGNGAMGVSNSMGANSLAILFSLGIPWFIRTMINKGNGTEAFINIQSYGIQFTLLSLLLATATLYVVIFLAGYRLKKLVGLTLILAYLIFVTFALLVELDVFFPTGNHC